MLRTQVSASPREARPTTSTVGGSSGWPGDPVKNRLPMVEATRGYRDPCTEVAAPYPRRPSPPVKRVGEGLWRALPLSPQAQRAAPLAPHGARTMTKDAMQRPGPFASLG